MSEILCERMKGRQLNTAFGQFKFDQQGIAEIPDEHVNKLLALSGYKLVSDTGGESVEPEKEDEPDAQNDTENGQMNKTLDEEENDQNDNKNDAEQVEDEQDEETEQEDEPKNSKPAVTVEYLNSKNVAQLKKIAKDNDIDLAGAAKKDEIIPIILGVMNQ